MGFSTRCRIIVLLALCAALLGCRAPRADLAIPKGTYYTQYSLHHERDVTRSTNYRRGELLPINTAVTLLSIGRDRAVVQVGPDGRKLTLEHLPRHTNDTLAEAFAKVFAAEPVDLSGFSPADQESIQSGKAAVGMDKQAVLAAMGPPPASGTATLEAAQWRYWDTRFSSFLVRFDNEGRVADVGR